MFSKKHPQLSSRFQQPKRAQTTQQSANKNEGKELKDLEAKHNDSSVSSIVEKTQIINSINNETKKDELKDTSNLDANNTQISEQQQQDNKHDEREKNQKQKNECVSQTKSSSSSSNELKPSINNDINETNCNNNEKPERKRSSVTFKEIIDEVIVVDGDDGKEKIKANFKPSVASSSAVDSNRWLDVNLDQANNNNDKKKNETSSFSLKSLFSGRMRFVVMSLSLVSPFIVTYQKATTSLVSEYMKSDEHFSSLVQSLIVNAYQFGHVPLQVPTSRLAEIYGPYWILASGSLLMGISSIATALLGAIHWSFTLITLALLGIFGGFMTPALFALFSNWLTKNEKSLYVTLYLVSSRVGSMLTAFASYLFIDIYHWTWKECFMFAGMMSIAFAMLSLIIVRSNPIEHKFISEDELQFLSLRNERVKSSINKREVKLQQIELVQPNKQHQNDSPNSDIKISHKKDKKAPWGAILSSKTVWAFIITKSSTKLCGEILQNFTSIYLYKVVGITGFTKSMGINYGCFCIGCLVSGFLCRAVIKRNILSKQVARKVFQSLGSFGVAFSILMLHPYKDNVFATKCIIAFTFFITTFGTSGEAQIPFDISTKYASTIHSMASTVATVISLLNLLTGIYFTYNSEKDPEAWKIYWLIVASISAFGGSMFVLLIDTSVKSFDKIVINETIETSTNIESTNQLNSNCEPIISPVKDENLDSASDCKLQQVDKSDDDDDALRDSTKQVVNVGRESGPI